MLSGWKRALDADCRSAETAGEVQGDSSITIEALEELSVDDIAGAEWSAGARHDPETNCLTVTIHTGGEEIPGSQLESYRQDIEEATGVEDVEVIQSDAEPASHDD